MLMRTDPFRELDRLTQQVFGTMGTTARPAAMPMDAWRDGDEFIVEFDLPGVDPSTVDLDVETSMPVPAPMVKQLLNNVLDHLAESLKQRAEQLAAT